MKRPLHLLLYSFSTENLLQFFMNHESENKSGMLHRLRSDNRGSDNKTSNKRKSTANLLERSLKSPTRSCQRLIDYVHQIKENYFNL